jgi:peptide-methionine (S)-S-oxide reductase
MTTYVVAGGCFWCLDAVYRRIKGVTKVVSGYTAGAIDHPTYYQVASGETGHAEAVEITFDESIIPSDVVLDLFFLIHNPTTLNRQGADEGTQYRSGMYYASAEQKAAFEAAIERASTHWDEPIVTEIEKLTTFWPAEDEHQDYFQNNPGNGYCSIVIAPKIVKARAAYAKWFQD